VAGYRHLVIPAFQRLNEGLGAGQSGLSTWTANAYLRHPLRRDRFQSPSTTVQDQKVREPLQFILEVEDNQSQSGGGN
jgi:hypothetical protein